MKYADFKEHAIKRTCKRTYEKPSGYRPYLEKDFHGRCCYCNMPRSLITSPFHVDHFIPCKEFTGTSTAALTRMMRRGGKSLNG